MNLRKRGLRELPEVRGVIAGNVIDPAVLKAPRIGRRIPQRLRGEDAACECKRGRIELEDGNIGELAGVGIEKTIVEDAARLTLSRLAEDPVLDRKSVV